MNQQLPGAKKTISQQGTVGPPTARDLHSLQGSSGGEEEGGRETDTWERCLDLTVTGTGPSQAHVAPAPLPARQGPVWCQGREPSGLRLTFTITSSHLDLGIIPSEVLMFKAVIC